MTGDAQAESERIVHDFQSYAIAYAEGDTRAFGTYAQRRSELVAALAAAMRNHGAQAHHGLCESIATEEEMMCDCGTAELREALSALRARVGEGTG